MVVTYYFGLVYNCNTLLIHVRWTLLIAKYAWWPSTVVRRAHAMPKVQHQITMNCD